MELEINITFFNEELIFFEEKRMDLRNQKHV